MTYLEICQRVDELLGTQGTFSDVTATGYQGMLAEYVMNAWLFIQDYRPDWHFFRTTVSISTVAAQTAYTINDIFGVTVDPVGTWFTDRFVKSDYDTLTFIPYDQWIIEDHTTSREPREFTVAPSAELGYLIFDNPDGIYTYTAHYVQKPQTLTADADVPIAPSEFHELIVWTAVADLAAYYGNRELFMIASTKADHLMGGLLRHQNPSKRVTTVGIV